MTQSLPVFVKKKKVSGATCFLHAPPFKGYMAKVPDLVPVVFLLWLCDKCFQSITT